MAENAPAVSGEPLRLLRWIGVIQVSRKSALNVLWWNPRRSSRSARALKLILRRVGARARPAGSSFVHGNAGDLVGPAIARLEYNCLAIESFGPRVAFCGSIGDLVRRHDVWCGIGLKRPEFLDPVDGGRVYGVRGHLTLSALKRAGVTFAQDPFVGDPGWYLARKFAAVRAESKVEETVHSSGPGLLLHYRHAKQELNGAARGFKVLSIDSDPFQLFAEILACSEVFTSSLHGIIFCHALEIPVHFVSPPTDEPMFKYFDYGSSNNWFPSPISLEDAGSRVGSSEVHVNSLKEEEFRFPSLETLERLGCIVRDF